MFQITELLLANEEMTYEDVKAAIGPPPFGEKKLVEMFETVNENTQNEQSTSTPSPQLS